jgi:DNA-binding CsgD family transcriptional regulator/Tfp pilus assembly protein PilF
MLETVKEYALERLEAAGEEEEVRRAHAAHYLALAQEARPELQGPRQAEWYDRLETEHDNLRAALSWSLQSRGGETALRQAAKLWWFWYKRGNLSEGRWWLEEALGKSTAPISVRAEVLNGAGVLARNQSDYEQAREWLEESLVLQRALGDEKGTADVLINLGTVALDRGNYPRARALFDESLSLRRKLRDRWGTALALNNLGVTAHAQGNLADAAPLYEESLKLFRALGDKAGIAMALSNLGEVVEDEGEYAKAVELYQESLALYREVEEKEGIAILTCCMGRIARIQGNYGRAARLYDESLRIYEELGNKLGTAQDLEGMAALRAACGQPELAARLWAAAEALREVIGAPPEDAQRVRHDPLIAAVRKALGEEEFTNAWTEGRELTPEQVLDGRWEQPTVDPEPTKTPAQLAGLTAGEIKILRLVASGMSNAQAAEKLFISRRTVDAHLRSIYRKLGVDSRTAAARHATDHGLV